MTSTQPAAPRRIDADTIERWRHELMQGGGVAGPGAALVDLLAALEDLKSAACALQAEAAVELDRAERDRQALAGVPARRRGLGVAAQVGLARRESPHRGAALLGAAKVWIAEMPHTFGALRAGWLTEHRAMLLVQETACLEIEDRREVDALLCADPSGLVGIGTRQLVASARAHAARLDPAAVVRRARRAESERCVTLRPAPDTMTYLTALLPVAQGVAAYAALSRAADAAAVVPDGGPAGSAASDDGPAGARRGRGQIMADTLVELVTGQSSASAVPVTVNLVLSDAALLGAGHESGHLAAGGPVPAQVARELVAAGVDADAAWLRRLYADPGGDLVAMTSRARFHPEGLAEFLRIRDQGVCRTPYCGAPVRHIDHIVPAAAGGPTTAENGEGLCVACNLAKEAPGWSRRPVQRAGPGHPVLTTTPTGHEYLSRAPNPPVPIGPVPGGSERRSAIGVRSAIDVCFAELVADLVA
ncbi:HNH endonuclease [Cellulomonas sp. ICMP 17802]|uniref:HNH endonuclease n=1 Tax=Cellulomonas sp. ICMP 17802 TaxID=3239199 RepID=UPI00351BC49A